MKLSIFLHALLLISLGLQAQNQDLEKVNSTVSKEQIQSHIYYLASDELQGRELGTPGIQMAADYIAGQFKKYGVQPLPGADTAYFQTVWVKKGSKPASFNLSINSELLPSRALALLSPANVEVNSSAIYLNYGTEDDYKGISVEGKIILVKSGLPDAGVSGSQFKQGLEKRALAQKHGALALIEYSAFNKDYWKSVNEYLNHEEMSLAMKGDEESNLPHIWINDQGNFFKEMTKGHILNVDLEISGISKSRISSYNVVGMVQGTDPVLKDEYIIYSAHYDHVGIGKPNAAMDSIYNGARDNAVGTVTVLSAAENIAKYPTRRSALFILFTGEEKGLLGSKWYVENPLIPLKQTVFCFNSDNASYNDTTKATIVGLERTTAARNIKQACSEAGLMAIDDPAPRQNLFDRSDNVHFAAKGVPAPTFSLGFTSFDAELFKYYHQVTDNPETLDYDYLTKFFRAYVLSCRMIANAVEKPFWIEGDKYHEAGLKLYGE